MLCYRPMEGAIDHASYTPDTTSYEEGNFEVSKYSLPLGERDFNVLQPLDNEKLQKYRQKELQYNKDVLSDGAFMLLALWDKLHSGKRDELLHMDKQTFIRSMAESYIKLKAGGIDVSDILKVYRHVDGSRDVPLDGKELEHIFHDLIAFYLSQYEATFSGNIIEKMLDEYNNYLQNRNAFDPRNFPTKKSILPWKQRKINMEYKQKIRKFETDKEQKEMGVALTTDDMQNYYIFKNMRDSNFTSILTPQNCNEEDYTTIKKVLDIYAFKMPSMIRYLSDYMEYKKDPSGFLEKIPDDMDRKIKKLDMDNAMKSPKEFEKTVIDLAKYYRFKCIYETKDNETLTHPQTLEEDRLIEKLLLDASEQLPERTVYDRRTDF